MGTPIRDFHQARVDIKNIVWYILAMKSKVIIRDPKILGGTPVFRGTRVPMQILIDYWESGRSIEDFLQGFPTVSEQQVVVFLKLK